MPLHPKSQRDFASPRSPLPILLNQFPISISIDPHRVNFKSISISSSQPRFLRIASFSIQSESRHKSSSRSLLHFFISIQKQFIRCWARLANSANESILPLSWAFHLRLSRSTWKFHFPTSRPAKLYQHSLHSSTRHLRFVLARWKAPDPIKFLKGKQKGIQKNYLLFARCSQTKWKLITLLKFKSVALNNRFYWTRHGARLCFLEISTNLKQHKTIELGAIDFQSNFHIIKGFYTLSRVDSLELENLNFLWSASSEQKSILSRTPRWINCRLWDGTQPTTG